VNKIEKRALSRARRKKRIRAKINGTEVRPRLSVFRSSKHFYAQVVDDVSGKTLIAASDVGSVATGMTGLKKADKARQVGELLADKCQQAGITTVVFDRNGFVYHGRVKAFAEGARRVRLNNDGVLESYGNGLDF